MKKTDDTAQGVIFPEAEECENPHCSACNPEWDGIHPCGWNHIHVTREEFSSMSDYDFSYSLGNYLRGIPEVILTGNVHPQVVGDIFRDLIDDWREGKPVKLGYVEGKLSGNYKLLLREIDPHDEFVRDEIICQLHYYRASQQHNFQSHPFRVIQVVWPNKDGSFGSKKQPFLKELANA